MSRTVASLVIVAFAAAAPLAAQSNGHDVGRVPPGHLPPAGTCRVWIDGVPPGRQPAPTSCARAERERAEYGRNARVLYGDRGARRDDRLDERWDDRRDDRWDDRRDGRSRRDERRYVDASGRVCTEKTEYKKNGNRKTTIECKASGRARDVVFTRCDDDVMGKRCQAQEEDLENTKFPSAYPATLPDMIGAIVFDRGQRTAEVTRWLGAGRYRVGYSDEDANGRPELVSWFDGNGRLVQQWIDGNRDGRADAVRIYRDGRLVRVVGGA